MSAPLRLNVSFKADGAIRTFDIIARNARDVAPMLRRWGGWLRADAKKHFEEQPGWAPLAQSTQERLKATRTSKITAAGQVRKSYLRRSEAGFRAAAKRGIINSGTQIAELRRLAAGGSTRYSLQAGQRRQSKALESLRRGLEKARTTGKRVGGDKRASENHRLLGKLGGSIVATIEGVKVRVESRVPWSGVHNEGGTAGKGARIPARVFLEITPEAAQALADIALDHFMKGEG